MISTIILVLTGIAFLTAMISINQQFKGEMRRLNQASDLRMEMIDRIGDVARGNVFPLAAFEDYCAMLDAVTIDDHMLALKQKRDPLTLYAPPLRRLMMREVA